MTVGADQKPPATTTRKKPPRQVYPLGGRRSRRIRRDGCAHDRNDGLHGADDERH